MSKLVLVVDDYADTRGVMRFMIEREGHQVIEAENGLEAVELVQKEHPDLIFMDLAMPVMDGFIASKRIRTKFSPGAMPIIAFTASGTSIREEVIKAGCNDIIFKPVEPSSLYPVLRKYLAPK